MIVAGRIGDLSAGTSQGVLERYNANGSLDNSFGNGGQVVSAAGGNDAWYAVTLADDGGILVSGTHAGGLRRRQVQAERRADRAFGDNGIATADLGGADDTAYDLAVGANGSIVLGGGSNGAFAFARFLKDGNLDAFFGQHGLALYAVRQRRRRQRDQRRRGRGRRQDRRRRRRRRESRGPAADVRRLGRQLLRQPAGS